MDKKVTENLNKEEEKKQEVQEKQEEEQKNQENIDDLDEGLDGFEDDNKLNVTASEKDPNEKEEYDPEVEKEFQNFMEQMQKGMGLDGGGEDGLKGMEQMMQGLLGGLGGPGGPGGAGVPGGEAGQDGMPKNMEDMFKNMDNNPQLDNLADHLLKEFMDKDVLEEPLKDAKENYEKFLEEQDEKLGDEEKLKYVNQLSCIDDILNIIEKDPNNKEEMIKKFEEMQEYGPPPQPLLNSFGKDSPFAMFQQMAGGQGGQGGQGSQEDMPPCTIF